MLACAVKEAAKRGGGADLDARVGLGELRLRQGEHLTRQYQQQIST